MSWCLKGLQRPPVQGSLQASCRWWCWPQWSDTAWEAAHPSLYLSRGDCADYLHRISRCNDPQQSLLKNESSPETGKKALVWKQMKGWEGKGRSSLSVLKTEKSQQRGFPGIGAESSHRQHLSQKREQIVEQPPFCTISSSFFICWCQKIQKDPNRTEQAERHQLSFGANLNQETHLGKN